ncbi:alpha/beta fold hydrolase BchO [Roseovarius sp. D22-M7]|uniref:alpha/beta fold hydrolase BchO n=1 Tax=Roseovarius sp. D22-M7 TaxID=3127116 RepID=UPI0030105933
MHWTRDLPTWPLHDLSRRIRHRPHDWHVQEGGAGDTILLIHGAGGSTHSWRDMILPLAEEFHVVALDLPGQGFTRAGTRRRLGLPAMAEDIHALCDAQGWAPRAIIGHSAGAAIALDLARRMTGSEGRPPDVIGINAALDRFQGVAGWLFPVLAKVLALNPLTATLFTFGGDPTTRARRLIRGTGSEIDARGFTCYGRLFSDRAHVDATLQMMAQWDVTRLLDHLPDITARCLLLTGAADSAVAPDVSARAAARLARAEVICMEGAGHLAHEEAPEAALAHIRRWLSSA